MQVVFKNDSVCCLGIILFNNLSYYITSSVRKHLNIVMSKEYLDVQAMKIPIEQQIIIIFKVKSSTASAPRGASTTTVIVASVRLLKITSVIY